MRRDARAEWGPFLRDLMPWTVVVNAATFEDRAIGYQVSRPMAVRRFSRFLEKMRHELGRPAEGAMACEVGPAGGLEHGHGLLSLWGGLQDGDITALSRLWRSVPGNGFVRLQLPLDDGWFADYMSKHTVKQLGDFVMSNGCGRVDFRARDGV
jgi:hypothetical protein